MIEAVIDSAKCYREQEGTYVNLRGWAFADCAKILSVQIWGNDVLLGFLPYGCLRPDVAAHFGGRCPSDEIGFHGQVRLTGPLSQLTSLKLSLVITSSESETKKLKRLVSWEEESQSVFSGLPVKLAAPNFFILGAGKCGTTSLHHALKQHPEIQFASVKEPSFFSTGFQVIKNPVDYFNLFPQQEGKKCYGEASHLYFSAPESAPVLRQLFPRSKFILIVRDPVHRAYSLYQHMRRSGDEVIPSFEQALEEEDKRYTDPEFRVNCPQYFWNFMYFRSSLYDLQWRQYLEYFPRDQFFILTLGEWKSDPKRWQREIFRFLEVDPTVEVTTEPQNQAGGYPMLSEDMRRQLQMKFQGLRERFEGMVGRTLDHWEF